MCVSTVGRYIGERISFSGKLPFRVNVLEWASTLDFSYPELVLVGITGTTVYIIPAI